MTNKYKKLHSKIANVFRWLFDDKFKFYKYHKNALAWQYEFRNYRGQKRFYDSGLFTTLEEINMKELSR